MKTVVCVDRCEGSSFSGRIYNPYMESVSQYSDVLELAIHMEDLFNDLSFPQAYFRHRTFGEPGKSKPQNNSRKEVARYMSDNELEQVRGEKLTFMVQVQYRQNATWQGTISWVDRKETKHFRSTLELIKLMDTAMDTLREDDEEGSTPKWD